MARCENQAQKVVANLVVNGGIEIQQDFLLDLQFTAQFCLLPLRQLMAAEVVDGAALCGDR